VAAGADGEAVPGWIVNRSSGGLALACPGPLTVGTQLKVRVTAAGETMPWVVMEVKHCTARGDRWFWCVGCKFTEALPAEVRALFR
jgi:hypothetical protein